MTAALAVLGGPLPGTASTADAATGDRPGDMPAHDDFNYTFTNYATLI